MFNSCINPWIYGATNRNYRRKFKRIICFWKKVQVSPEETDITARERGTRSSNDARTSKTEHQPEESRTGDYLAFKRDGSQVNDQPPQGESAKDMSMAPISQEDIEGQIQEEDPE